MKVNLCRDPALVVSACLRIRTKYTEVYLWRVGWRLRVMRLKGGEE